MAEAGGEITIRDDTSSMGLRRFHAIRACGCEEAAEWAAGVIGRMVGDGQLLGSLVYEDEGLGLWHVRVYWKETR